MSDAHCSLLPRNGHSLLIIIDFKQLLITLIANVIWTVNIGRDFLIVIKVSKYYTKVRRELQDTY